VRVDRIELAHVRIPLHAPFRISSGAVSEKDAIITKVFAEGLIGWGESSPMAGTFYSEDSPESTWTCLRSQIIPRIIDKQVLSREDLCTILDQIEGNSFAKAGVETAWWDLEAQQKGVPLYTLLGGTRKRIASGLAVGIYSTIDELLRAIERQLSAGYQRIKIKIEPGWDIEPVRAVSKAFPSLPLMVDANAAYGREDVGLFQQLDEFQLIMFEQPLKKTDLEGHAELQSKIKTPICLDESLSDLTALKRAIQLGSCQVANIKIQRMGGLQTAREGHDYCAKAGIPVWAGTMPELGIGSAQALHLATLPNFIYPTDVEASYRWFVDDIIEPWITVKEGWIELLDGIGYGFKIDEQKLKRYTIRSEVFR